MDFFGRQQQARRNTFWLVVLYSLAVACIIGSVYLAVALIFSGGGRHHGRMVETVAAQPLWNPELLLWVGTITLLVIVSGTVYKIVELGGSGSAVARMLGGREVAPNTRDAAERRLVNVVEEMAIAAGMPVPGLFVLDDEDGINAFAAGTTTGNAVVAVTRGALQTLNRDELQGVVGHEFSHILNGDMRLNLRMIGVLNGILLIALIGQGILRGSGRVRVGGGKKDGGGGILFLALALLVIGWIGVFFARLIQAAVSRQREYLADAAAVQFTRNPAGLAGALKKIAGFTCSSKIESANASSASHLFFADGLTSWFTFFATHPPLAARIRFLDPAFTGELPHVPSTFVDPEIQDSYGARGGALSSLAGGGFPPAARNSIPFTPQGVMPQVGTALPEHLGQAQEILAALPPELVEAAHDPVSAMPVVYGLLLDRGITVREAQYAALAAAGVPPVEIAALRGQEPQFLALPRGAKLPLAQISLPALRQLPPEEKAHFLAATEALVNADGSVDLFEYMLRRMLARRLGGGADSAKKRGSERQVLLPLLPACQKVLSLLAWVGTDVPETARKAFLDGVRELSITPAPELLPLDRCGLAEVDQALGALDAASPVLKRRILAACIACVGADGIATEAEAELLRAVADSLDCPIPLLSATPATVFAAA